MTDSKYIIHATLGGQDLNEVVRQEDARRARIAKEKAEEERRVREQELRGKGEGGDKGKGDDEHVGSQSDDYFNIDILVNNSSRGSSAERARVADKVARIDGVHFQNELYRVELLLGCHASVLSFDNWRKIIATDNKNGFRDFYPPSLPLAHAVFNALYDHKDNTGLKDKIDEIAGALRNIIVSKGHIGFLSGLEFVDNITVDGDTEIVHYLPEKVLKYHRSMGNGWGARVTACLDDDFVSGIFGTGSGNPAKVRDVYKWLFERELNILTGDFRDGFGTRSRVFSLRLNTYISSIILDASSLTYLHNLFTLGVRAGKYVRKNFGDEMLNAQGWTLGSMSHREFLAPPDLGPFP